MSLPTLSGMKNGKSKKKRSENERRRSERRRKKQPLCRDGFVIFSSISYFVDFFQRCLANENIACDVDKILQSDPARQRDDD